MSDEPAAGRTSASKLALLSVASVPTQTPAPLRLIEGDSRVRSLVAYCTLPDARLLSSDEDLTREAFDVPMLEGYSWRAVPNWAPSARLDRCYGLINLGLVPLVARCDCCIVYGHQYVSFWLAMAAARLGGKALILTTDATSPGADRPSWRKALKLRLLRLLYTRVADLVLVPSTAARRFVCSLGVPADRVIVTPYVVDNDAIAAAAARADRAETRERLQIPLDARVLLFCGKFLPRKRPHDAVRAFARAAVADGYLIMAGDGPLRASLVDEIARSGVASRVRLTGLVQYSRLPAMYAASDLLVVPSDHEPYGLPVNEAMICGTPVIVTDRVGAADDLVEHGRTGFVYPAGDVDALAVLLAGVLPDRTRVRQMGDAARERMRTWSPRENADATVRAAERAIALRRAGRH